MIVRLSSRRASSARLCSTFLDSCGSDRRSPNGEFEHRGAQRRTEERQKEEWVLPGTAAIASSSAHLPYLPYLLFLCAPLCASVFKFSARTSSTPATCKVTSRRPA